MQMEPVRVLLSDKNTNCGIIATAEVESTARMLAGIFGLQLRSERGWLIRSAPVYGFNCVILGDRIYPVRVVQDGFLQFQVIDLTETVVLACGGGDSGCAAR